MDAAHAVVAPAERGADVPRRAAGPGVTTSELVALLELVVVLADAEAAATVAGRLEGLRGQFATTPGNFTVIARHLGGAALLQNDRVAARAYYEQALEVRRETGDKQGTALTLQSLGYLAYIQGDYELAQSLIEQGLAIGREVGDKWMIAWALYHLGLTAQAQEDYERARTYFEQSLALSNIASMLKPGGFLLSNNGLTEVPSIPMRSVGYTTVVYSDRPGDGDRL